MTTCKGWESAERRTGTAKSMHVSKNVEMRNASFMAGPLRNFLLAGEHGSTEALAGTFSEIMLLGYVATSSRRRELRKRRSGVREWSNRGAASGPSSGGWPVRNLA